MVRKWIEGFFAKGTSPLDRFARIILGYHGCEPEFAESLVRGEIVINAWQPSRNPYDWLGHGVYFWEHAPHRAAKWGGRGGVIGAVIQLGVCLDLTETRFTSLLAAVYQSLRRSYKIQDKPLPKNRGKRRDLDCLVMNEVMASAQEGGGSPFQTVRSPFLEGRPAFPGSGIRRESHIQIAVIDTSCILGVFRPNLG
jgi:hypothetical protein